jgi:hypothetical protein
LKKIQGTWVFSGAPDKSFGSTFGPGSTGWKHWSKLINFFNDCFNRFKTKHKEKAAFFTGYVSKQY